MRRRISRLSLTFVPPFCGAINWWLPSVRSAQSCLSSRLAKFVCLCGKWAEKQLTERRWSTQYMLSFPYWLEYWSVPCCTRLLEPVGILKPASICKSTWTSSASRRHQEKQLFTKCHKQMPNIFAKALYHQCTSFFVIISCPLCQAVIDATLSWVS